MTSGEGSTITVTYRDLRQAFMYWNREYGTTEERVEKWKLFWTELRDSCTLHYSIHGSQVKP